MCCSSDPCAAHHCRCICMRCRICDTCNGEDSGFGSGLVFGLMTGSTKSMVGSLAKTKVAVTVPPHHKQNEPPPELLPRKRSQTSQGAGIVKATVNGCAQQ